VHDEPLAVSERARMHYAACQRCQERFERIRADARQAAALLEGPLPAVDGRAALHRVRGAARPATAAYRKVQAAMRLRPGLVRVAALGLVAATIAGVLMGTGAAQSFLTIFEPRQFAPITVTQADLVNGMAELSNYGALKWTEVPAIHEVADAQAAAAESGLRILTPASLPPGVPSTARYVVSAHSAGTFTFSAERAKAAAAQVGKRLPAMPASIDGSTLYVAVGPVVLQVYGKSAGGDGISEGGLVGTMPALVILEEKMPSVSSSGVSLRQLLDYLLAQPGISPRLAGQIRAISDPATTLPVPIPLDLATSHAVQVQHVRGLFVGDSTGLGSGIIWQKDGVIYGVAGTLTESQVRAIADSLR